MSPAAAPDIWILIGHIAATYKPEVDPAPPDLLQAFHSSLVTAESGCLSGPLKEVWDLRTAYYLVLAALALAGHPLGKLVMDNLFPHTEAESAAICPSCNNRVRVAFFNSGVEVLANAKSHASAPVTNRILDGPRVFQALHRSPNSWKSMAGTFREFLQHTSERPDLRLHLEAAGVALKAGISSDLDIGIAFSVLGGLLTLKGFPGPAMRYFHAWDKILCPLCKREFIFADHWWLLKK